VQRAKTVLYRAKELNVGRTETQILSLTLRGVVDNDPDNPEGLVPDDYATYQVFEPDDLVFKLIDLENVRTSRVGLVPKRGAMSSAYLRLRPRRGVSVRFLYWSFFDLYNRQIFNHLGSGVRSTLGAGDVLNLPLALPDEMTQHAIADYLDAETARIDALIAKKQRMVKLLGERFESSIFHAVTRGIRETRGMRSSNLDWLTELPMDWATPRVSYNFQLQLGKMLNAEAASGAIQSPYLRNVNVQWDRIDQSDLATMHFSEADRRRCELRTGDVLVCEGGEVGRSAVWNGEVQDCYFQKAIHRARPRTNANGRFLMYCLRAAAKMNVFAVEGNQSTIVHLTGEQLSAHRFPWPPPDEQQGIVYRLDTDKADTEATRKKLMDQVDLLSERRQALITAAVTGDLEIPGVAA
jgi:type I restriction enzyme S subunit